MSHLPIEIAKVTADVVVIGCGGAAAWAALSARLAGAEVRLAAKAPLRIGGSSVHGAIEIMSMGAAGFGDRRDNPQIHFEDTMRAGQGFISPALVRVPAEDAPARIRDLIVLGVPFDRMPSAAPAGEDYWLIESDFGSYARALGVGGKTGRAFLDALADELARRGVAEGHDRRGGRATDADRQPVSGSRRRGAAGLCREHGAAAPRAHGEGQRLDLSLLEGAVFATIPRDGETLFSGKPPT
jgi:succinate dehydrogenase/fumarate reductase flavoprotein subunit